MQPFCVLVSFFFAVNVFAQKGLEKVRSYHTKNESGIYNEFISFLQMLNVATDTANIRRNADYLVNSMKAKGISNLRLLKANDNAVSLLQAVAFSGSLPVDDLVNVLNAKFLIAPIANFANGQHAENENIRLKNFRDGIGMMASTMLMK